jgi:hypothetical protein
VKPLANAARRLRKKPGRPVKRPQGRKPAEPTIDPRLLDMPNAEAYSGLSRWTLRGLEAAGVLQRVHITLPNGRELRKTLYDRRDLDMVIDQKWKGGQI